MLSFSKIYINRDRKKTEVLMKEAVDGGCRGFFLTVDSPTLGNREADFRVQGLAGNVSISHWGVIEGRSLFSSADGRQATRRPQH